MPHFNFGELIPNGYVTVFQNLFVAVEIVMMVCGKDRNMAGAVLRNISQDQFSSTKFVERKMPGKGNARTKLITFEDSIELIMILPGKIAKDIRLKMVDIIKRYLAGDKSLIQEVEHNATSDAPIHKMAREECMEGSSEEPEIMVGYKRMHESVTMSRELVSNAESVTKHMREQNGLARERWDMDLAKTQERNDLELKHARAKYELKCLEFQAELNFKRELAQIVVAQQDPSGGQCSGDGHDDTTVLSTFVKHNKQFTQLKRNQEIVLLREAGKKAAQEYFVQHHAYPKKISEGVYTNVNSYPKSFEPTLLEILQDTYRVLRHGAGQQTLPFAPARPSATIVVNLP